MDKKDWRREKEKKEKERIVTTRRSCRVSTHFACRKQREKKAEIEA